MADNKENKEVNKPNSDKIVGQNVNVDNLRFLSVEQIDNLINYIVSSNQAIFDSYFTLLKVKEQNRIAIKPATKEETDKTDDKP